MSRKQLSIEQGHREPVYFQLLSYLSKLRGVIGQFYREQFVFRWGSSNKFAQSNSSSTSLRQRACIRFANPGQYRQAAPKRVACRRMRVIRRRIEEQIGQSVTGKMLGRRGKKFGKYQPSRIDACRLGCFSKLLSADSWSSDSHKTLPSVAFIIVIQDLKHLRIDLVCIIKTTKNETILRQAKVGSNERLVRNLVAP